MRFRLRSPDGDIGLPEGRFYVGRSRECQLFLDDPLVSRRHAVLFMDGDRVVLEDLGSRNGTLVNGARIEGPVSLVPGDRVSIGARVLELAHGERNRERRQTQAQGFPSGAYERPPATMRPPSPVIEDVTRSVSIFGMLLASCERALERGDVHEAESSASNLAVSVRAELLRGRTVDPHTMNEIVGTFLDLSERSGAVRWVERIFEIFGAAKQVIDAESIARIHEVVSRLGFDVRDAIEGYLTRLRAREAELGDGDRELLARVGALAS